MKISVSLPEADVEFVDRYAEKAAESRSAAIHEAIELLRESQLEEDYAAAWEEWEGSEDAGLWEQSAADGVADAPR